MPEGVASVANEEKILSFITMTAEPGVIGGVPASGLDFGAAVNTDAVIEQNQQFDFYDGGGLDLAVLGMAECDAGGNVNVSRFGPRLAGAGGFINIAQNSAAVVFVGSFTAGGLQVEVEGGQLRIKTEGRARKFVKKVQQVTFGGKYAAAKGQKILYVTERCVFELTPEGVELVEVAPGIDLQRDILALMDFAPIVRDPVTMDARIFDPAPMKLKDTLLALKMTDRVVFDANKETLFCNFQGLVLRSKKDIDELRDALEPIVAPIGHKVAAVINYDDFQIDETVIDDYAEGIVRYFGERYLSTVSRYTTSAFLRVKLGEALDKRGLSARIYETQRELMHGLVERLRQGQTRHAMNLQAQTDTTRQRILQEVEKRLKDLQGGLGRGAARGRRVGRAPVVREGHRRCAGHGGRRADRDRHDRDHHRPGPPPGPPAGGLGRPGRQRRGAPRGRFARRSGPPRRAIG